MNRRIRMGSLHLHEVAENLAPFRPHVDNFQTSAATPSAADESVGVTSSAPAGSTTSGEKGTYTAAGPRPVRGLEPENGGEKDPLGHRAGTLHAVQAQLHDLLHTYMELAAGHDHDRATPAYYKAASTIEALAQNLARRSRAEQDAS